MSIPVRHSGRIAFAALIVITLIASLIGVRMFAVAAAPPPRFDIGTTTQPTFTIGPIDGLTTTWHWAPRATSIPLGTIAEFFQPATPDATVIWTGAAEVARDLQGSFAVCPLVQLGITMVKVQVIPADGSDAFSSQSSFNVVDIDVEQITVSAIDAWVETVEIDADLPQDEINELTMAYFFGLDSIAALRDLGGGFYRTSVNRRVYTSVEVNPPGFAPLIEWRYDGQPVDAPPAIFGMGVNWSSEGMGATAATSFPLVGHHVIEVGPVFNPEVIEVETYRVTITSHTSGEDIIPEGEPIVFTAETNPPGYEDEITWLASTMYGTAEPILGEGPVFVAEFNDTWGIDENGDLFQWFGVKGDYEVFNQDQKGTLEITDTFDQRLDDLPVVETFHRVEAQAPPPPLDRPAVNEIGFKAKVTLPPGVNAIFYKWTVDPTRGVLTDLYPPVAGVPSPTELACMTCLGIQFESWTDVTGVESKTVGVVVTLDNDLILTKKIEVTVLDLLTGEIKDALAADISATDTMIPLNDASGFPAAGMISIESEFISYTGKNGNTLTGATRGLLATTPLEHDMGTSVVTGQLGIHIQWHGDHGNVGDYGHDDDPHKGGYLFLKFHRKFAVTDFQAYRDDHFLPELPPPAPASPNIGNIPLEWPYPLRDGDNASHPSPVIPPNLVNAMLGNFDTSHDLGIALGGWHGALHFFNCSHGDLRTETSPRDLGLYWFHNRMNERWEKWQEMFRNRPNFYVDLRSKDPDAGPAVPVFTKVTVTFTEPVTGLHPMGHDLKVNGQMATMVMDVGGGGDTPGTKFEFSGFPPPPGGSTVTIELQAGNIEHVECNSDPDGRTNPFSGETWMVMTQ